MLLRESSGEEAATESVEPRVIANKHGSASQEFLIGKQAPKKVIEGWCLYLVHTQVRDVYLTKYSQGQY